MTDIQRGIRRLRSRARMAMLLYGASCLLITLLGGLFLVGLADWLIHIDEPATRLTLLLLVLGLGVLLAWRLLLQPMRQKLSDVSIAMKIERRYPGFRDSLASTVEFMEAHMASRLGSPELQRHVVQETENRLSRVSLDDVVETQPVRVTSGVAIGVCAVLALTAGLRPAAASLALERMVFPFSAPEWPRKTHLRLLDADLNPVDSASGEPIRRVEGETFKFYVDNTTGSIPEDLTLFLKYGDGETEKRELRRVSVRNGEGHVRTLAIATILVERGPVRFRIVGGDDDTMPTQTIKVVPPPQLESLQVTLTPPAYSRLPKRDLPKDVGHFEGLVGTTVTVQGTCNKSLNSADLRLRSEPPRSLKLSRDGKRFQTQFLIRESGNYSYWFELKDQKGFGNPHAVRYNIRARNDRVPVVRLTSPSGDLTVTPGTAVQLAATVEDDLGVREVSLRYQMLGTASPSRRVVTLWHVDDQPADNGKAGKPQAFKDIRVPYSWTLSGVTVGTQFRYYVEAEDHFNLGTDGRPAPAGQSRHVGKSLTHTITIVTPEDKKNEIARKYGELLEDLKRAERKQGETHDQVGQLLIQLKEAGKLRKREDLILLKRINREQREIEDQLVGDKRGVEQRARELLQELQANKLKDSNLQRRLQRIISELAALRVPPLQQTAANLREVENELEGSGKKQYASPQTRGQLTRAKAGQSAVLQSLRELIGELSEWRNWHDLKDELKRLIRAQNEINREAETLKKQTLGKTQSQLTDQHKADLARLAERQRRLADRLDRFDGSLQQFLKRLKADPEGNRSAIETLGDVADMMKDSKIADAMRSAARQIGENHLGEATPQQKQLTGRLKEAEAILENRQTDDLGTIIKRQKKSEAELETLQKQQEDVAEQLRKLGDAPKTPEDREQLKRLIKKQKELRNEATEMARRLRRLSANQANRSTQRAAESMQQAAESLQREALLQGRIEQQESLDALKQARRQLARKRAQNEAALAQERLEQLVNEIEGLIARQKRVIEGTERLKKEHVAAGGKWSRPRLMTLDLLQAEQTRLKSRVAELSAGTTSAAVFSLVLSRAGDAMGSAAKLLSNSRADAENLSASLTAQHEALRQLEQLKSTLQFQPKTQSNDGQTGSGQQGAAKLSGPDTIAQLKLLKTLQEQIAARTAAFDKKRKGRKKLKQPEQAAVEQLANEQDKLADLVADLMRQLNIKLSPDAKQSPVTKEKNESVDVVLNRIVRRMRSAGSRLAEELSGADTQTAQQAAVEDLEKLLKSAKLSASSSSSGSNSGQKQSTSGKQPKQKENATGKKKSGTQGKKAGSSTAKKSTGKSERGVRNQTAEQMRKLEIARRSRLIEEIWGHLPEHRKQMLRSVAGERYLPRYKSLISKYFESLAE